VLALQVQRLPEQRPLAQE
jgi:hypothetical protein